MHDFSVSRQITRWTVLHFQNGEESASDWHFKNNQQLIKYCIHPFPAIKMSR